MTTHLEEVVKNIGTLDQFIEYLETTTDNEWCVGVVREKGNVANCMFGHLVNWYYGKDYEGNIVDVWDLFEEIWATTYMVYPVNDGENPKYPQLTPKRRVIAYLKDLNTGVEKNTQMLWNETIEEKKSHKQQELLQAKELLK